MKPVYDNADIIAALTTADGSEPSVAWSVDIVTYSINTGAVGPEDPEYTAEMDGYVALSAAMEACARETFELWDDVIAVDLLEMDDWPSAHMTFNYSSATEGGATYARYNYWLVDNAPRSQFKLADADVWMADDWASHDEDADLTQGSYGLMTYLHEVGHALGISHPGPYNLNGTYETDATHLQDTREYTIMSYFDAGADGSATDHVGSGGWSYAATPLLHDILAAQAVYGADMTTRTGNTVYGFNATAGRDAFDFTVNTDPVVAIWDAGGTDVIDASGFATDQVVDLGEGAFSSVGSLTRNVAIAYGAVIEQALGGAGDDLITGNWVSNVLTGNGGDDTIDGGGGDDLLRGGAGTDMLVGGDGPDLLFGGAGADAIDGGPGEDWARFNAAPGPVSVSLLAGTGSAGEAAGDTYAGVENITGSAFADALTGDNYDNRIDGVDGADSITGNSGHDFLLGGAGDDVIDGGFGFDLLRGGPGADELIGDIGTDWAQYNTAVAGVALSLATGGTGGEAAGDTFSSVENVRGSAFADDLAGDTDRNLIMAGAGDDMVTGGGGPDVLHGEAGDDRLTGADQGDELWGGPGADLLDGAGGNDWARYDTSPEGVSVNLAAATAAGGDAAGDTLIGVEFLRGSAFADTLVGDAAVNILRGGDGDDLIRGNGGQDILDGVAGADVFAFGTGDGIDKIYNFELAADLIRFDGVAGVDGFGDLDISDFRGDAAVAYGPGDVVLVVGLDHTLLDAGHFDFV